MPASTLRSALYTFALNRDKLNSIYLIDLQKLSPETGPPKIEHYDEFSERLLLDSRVVELSIASNPTFVILSSLKPFFFGSVPVTCESHFRS